MKNLSKIFNNRVVLVTGGTGSFGSFFVKKTLEESRPKKLIIFSRDELKQFEMQNRFKNSNLRFFLGDVRDKERLLQAFKGVDYVVHAAALKQVNAAEYNPEEFIKTNIIGAQNVINASIACKVLKVISLSTDKASNPKNLYGVTKLCSDKLFISGNNLAGLNGTKFSIVRYGNVSGSRGSIIPLYQKLLNEKKKYLPITDMKMTRFLITLNEAYDFVCKSFINMSGGETFIPKLPSIKIIDVANALDNKIKKKIIGIRPGEKIHETMFSENDGTNIVEFKDYYVIIPETIFFKKNSYFLKNKLASKGKMLKKTMDYSSGNNIFLTISEIKKKLNI